MAGLSNIFGGDNQDSSQDSSNDTNLDNGTVADATNVLGIDANSSHDSTQTDSDGSSSSDSSDQSFGLNSNTDGLLGSVTDLVSSHDQSSDQQ